MRVYFTLTRFGLVLIGVCVAMSIPAIASAAEPGVESPQIVIAQPPIPVNLMAYSEPSAITQTAAEAPVAKEAEPSIKASCDADCGGCVAGLGCCPQWFVGVEAVWMTPTIKGQYASYGITNAQQQVVNYYKDAVPSGLFMTPRISLGYQGENCWGIQARYWRMNEPKNIYLPSNGETFNALLYENALKAETVDLEATRLFYLGETKNLLSVGARYAQLDHSGGVFVTQELGGDLYSGSAYSRQNFNGPGLTLGLTGYRPLQNRNFNLFYSVRGSMLWDNTALNIAETGTSFIGDETAEATGFVDVSRDNGTMFIGEFQIGAQWNFELVRHCADAFIRLALEYQYWDTDRTGRAVATSSAGGTAFTGTSTATTGDTRLDMAGFTVATGFTW